MTKADIVETIYEKSVFPEKSLPILWTWSLTC